MLEDCKAQHVDFREGDFSHADFNRSFFTNCNLSSVNFSEAIGYDIDIQSNIIKSAKFSRFEAMRLLDNLEIELID